MYRIASMLHIVSHDLAMIENEDFDTFDEYKRIVSDVYEQKIRSMKAFEKKSKKRAYQNLQMSIRHVRKCLEHVVEDLQEMTSIEDLQEAIKQSYTERNYRIYINNYMYKEEVFEANVYRSYAVYLEVRSFLMF